MVGEYRDGEGDLASQAGEPLIPVRTSLVGECVRVMKARIEQGEWTGVLPGERRVADSLRVGRDTVRLALQQLEKEGVISTAERGMRRRVVGSPDKKAAEPKQFLKVGMLSPWNLELLPQPLLLEVDRIRMALASMGGAMTVISPSWYHSSRPERRLNELLTEQACNAWVLLRSTAEIQRCMVKAGVPCMVRGYPHEGVNLPYLDVDWGATARHSAAVLWRLGHRRIAVLTPPDAMQGVTAALQGIYSLGEDDLEPVELKEDGTVTGVARVLSRAFLSDAPPTAIIATRPRQAATALSWLQSGGRRVPEDVSLLVLGHEPFIDNLLPQLACYMTSPEMVARRLVRRIEVLCQGHGAGGASPWINPDFRSGGSIGMVGS